MGREEILRTFAQRARGADVSLIEGNKGLYDGLDLDGSSSNAALAQLLGAPVVLVIDARGMTRGIAPLILGYQAFDRQVRIAGVILNQLGGSRHEAKLRAVIEHYTDVPVLGAVHFDDRLAIVERHLGLIPSNEAKEAAQRIETIAAAVARQVALARVLTVARAAPPLSVPVAGDDALSQASPARGRWDLEDIEKEPSPRPLPPPPPFPLIPSPASGRGRRAERAARDVDKTGDRARQRLRLLLSRRPRGAARRGRGARVLQRTARHAPARGGRPLHRRRFS